jgi:hypothetical protein
MVARRHIIIALFVVTAAAVNVTKAVHIDDTAYLEMARAILHDPLHPMSQSVNWGDSAEPIFEINQPLLVPYVFAVVMKIWGDSELALHLVTALASALAIAVFYLLVTRLQIRSPLFLTGLFALGPSFLPGQNVMVDMPLMALWLVFFWAILCIDADGSRKYVIAACAVAGACLTKYTSLALLPILVFAIVYRRHWRSAWVCGVPVGVLMLWSWFNYADVGAIHLLGRARPAITAQMVGYRVISWIAGLGSISPFVLSLISVRRKGPAGRMALALAVASSAALSVLMIRTGRTDFAAYWLVFFAGGVLATIFVASSLYRDVTAALRARDQEAVGRAAVLASWIAGTAAFVILFSPSIAVRHIFLAVPPILILLGRQLSTQGRLAAKDMIGFALTAVLGLSLAVSDYAFAGVYRSSASSIRSTLPQSARVFQTGHWGWQWYATKAGMIQYDMTRTRLQRGDYLVAPVNVHRQEIATADAPDLQEVHRLSVPAPRATYLRTMYTDGESGGYYSFEFPGVTPWRLSRAPFEFDVFRFTR